METDEIRSLSKKERRYLSKRTCALCGMPLDRPGCSAIWDPCTEKDRRKRRAACLEEYKPRGR